MLKIMTKKDYASLMDEVTQLRANNLKMSLENAKAKEIKKENEELKAENERLQKHIKKRAQTHKTKTKKWLNGYPGETYEENSK